MIQSLARQAILFASLNLGSAHNPHVLRVRLLVPRCPRSDCLQQLRLARQALKHSVERLFRRL
ncbi:hypothetical protein HA41_10320 [Pantoea conspicua]|uniref:L-asparaginase n=1 Tax=Pantoea conspicua TaxID=472705 RepID=A0A1X1BW57_9GAMM|nr:hypothetical protein HA41_10320 [Pantoea conspicua]